MGSKSEETETKLSFSDIAPFYDLITAQHDNGNYCLKRMTSFFTKVADLEKQYAQDLAKIISYEKDKIKNSGWDKMPRTWNFVLEVFDATKDYGASKHNFSETLHAELLQKLNARLADDSSENRKNWNSKKESLEKTYLASRDAVDKYRNKCLKQYAAKIEHDRKDERKAKQAKTGTPPRRSIFSKKGDDSGSDSATPGRTGIGSLSFASKPKGITDANVLAYSKLIETANRAHNAYYVQELPALVYMYEQLEVNRMTLLRDSLAQFTEFHVKNSKEYVEKFQKLNDKLVAFNPQDDICAFAERVYAYSLQQLTRRVSEQGIAVIPGVPEYDLPMENEVKTDFNSSLYEIMALQSKTNAKLGIPRIIPALISAVRDNGGYSTEGIFRISPGNEELNALREQLIEGNYNITTDNPHIPAALLKEWLRGLPEPVIPASLYNKAIALGQDTPSSAKEYYDLLQELPHVNRAVVVRLIQLMKSLARPENSEKSRMDEKNLGIVFAPSLLRGAAGDASAMLVNSTRELKFVMNLVHVFDFDVYCTDYLFQEEKPAESENSRSASTKA